MESAELKEEEKCMELGNGVMGMYLEPRGRFFCMFGKLVRERKGENCGGREVLVYERRCEGSWLLTYCLLLNGIRFGLGRYADG